MRWLGEGIRDASTSHDLPSDQTARIDPMLIGRHRVASENAYALYRILPKPPRAARRNALRLYGQPHAATFRGS